MAKPKAPRWLTQAFADGVDERETLLYGRARSATRRLAVSCWLAQHDERSRPCSGRLERAHLIPRQRVENALGALLPTVEEGRAQMVEAFMEGGPREWYYSPSDLILLAAWDPRNGMISCEHHHRRYDGHACSPRAPKIVVPAPELPDHMLDFIFDWGLENQAEDRFPNFIRY